MERLQAQMGNNCASGMPSAAVTALASVSQIVCGFGNALIPPAATHMHTLVAN